MTMGIGNVITGLALNGLLFLNLGICISSAKDCSCPGPLSYYKDVHCTPVFENEGDCCAIRYNCDNLKNLPTDKCVINGREYDIGENLREEDSNPCDIGCTCILGYSGLPSFNCAIVDCFYGPVTPGCYRQNVPTNCCPGPEICPENPEDRPICIVDGKTYRDGEAFTVTDDPDLSCYCALGYNGSNVEPFCARPKHSYCGIELHGIEEVVLGCAPIYYSNQSPQTSCSVASRCQNDKDAVIAHSTDNQSNDPDLQCQFGNLTMRVGDELNQATDYSSVCVKCVCEVPPVPTCQRLPDDECDVTNHPNFNKN